MPEILLEMKTFICGQKNVESLCFGSVKQIPVGEPVPSMLGRCFDGETLQKVPEGNGNIVVKQNSHVQVLLGCLLQS
jgi:hypothetical protein